MIPVLEGERLRLRPFRLDDAARVEELAGDYAIADTTANVPHPYPSGLAAEWISKHESQFAEGKAGNWAMTLRDSGELLGSISYMRNLDHQRAEIGYWIGKPYWSQGYTTEAARLVLGYCFEQLGLRRVMAYYFVRNPASGRVMQKIGMQQEGLLRAHVCKGEQFEDVVVCGILREEWQP